MMGRYLDELTRIFKTVSDKREAHLRSRGVLQDISADPSFVTAVLEKYLSIPGVLNKKNYPVVAMEVVSNPYYDLVVNCWIPLPGRENNVSTKAIHHHGVMLLTTTTIFGPGYNHWLFNQPREVDPERELYAMELVEKQTHHLHHVAFVDSYAAHLPLYPSDFTMTLALWSHERPTTWRDYLKRIPILKRNATVLRDWGAQIGLEKPLDLNIVKYFDFYPTTGGFKGMKERIELPLGPNVDYLQSLFCVIQRTGNEGLGRLIQWQLDSDSDLSKRQALKDLLQALRDDRPIEGKLSACHFGVSHATFTTQDIERALEAQGRL